MSLAASNLTSGHAEGATVTGFTTASVSPSANALLVLSVGGFDGTGSQDFTVNTTSGLSLTWTRRKLGVAGSTPKGDVEVWTAVCGASPGSGTITVAFTSAFSGGTAWAVDQFTGEDTTTPVVTGNIVSGNNSSAASSVTYGTAASSSNLFHYLSVVLLGGTGSASQSPSETPAWTSLSNLQSDTTTLNGVSLHTQVSPDVTHLTGSASWSPSHSWGTIGLEIAAAAAGTPSPFAQPGTPTAGRSAARKGTSAGSAGAPRQPRPSPFTAPHGATRGAMSARAGNAHGSPGAPRQPFPSPFRQPPPAKGCQAARTGRASGITTGSPRLPRPSPFRQPGPAKGGQAARTGRALGITTGAPRVIPSPFTAPKTVAGRKAARKGTAAGSPGAPRVAVTFTPSPFTQPGTAMKGAQRAVRGRQAGSPGAPFVAVVPRNVLAYIGASRLPWTLGASRLPWTLGRARTD